MGVPLNHPNFIKVFHYKPTILGIPHLWKAPFVYEQETSGIND